MGVDNEELEATRRLRRKNKCEFCDLGEKFSTNYIDVVFEKTLPSTNNQVVIKFKGCPEYSKCSSKDFVQIIKSVFFINYCPMCRKKVR